ncbi:hypothetical protein BDY21DRAFT_2850 [Lineolata rhizophorae]|uniref:Uncharacterized protein n=1 Tax=Lineolata rhizophorae TaxID=578093 RepID=A0A6A6PDP8_9PEZI|nr:hypothetical protein BDY21DRAFT_2850 [Lineolata rhizophorae]
MAPSHRRVYRVKFIQEAKPGKLSIKPVGCVREMHSEELYLDSPSSHQGRRGGSKVFVYVCALSLPGCSNGHGLTSSDARLDKAHGTSSSPRRPAPPLPLPVAFARKQTPRARLEESSDSFWVAFVSIAPLRRRVLGHFFFFFFYAPYRAPCSAGLAQASTS